MADTLKKVRMDHQRILDNNKGASESTRTALSAISGRNILKTKTETEKLRRNEEIAAQQNAALKGISASNDAVTMERARLSAAQQGESLALSRDRLGLSRERLEHQKKRQRQNQILSMLNMGIYESSFAAELNMSDSVVKQAAANKAAEINARKAAKAAAEKAQAEYEDLLNEINDRKKKTQTKEWYASAVETAIDEAETVGIGEGTAAEIKEGILSSAGLEKTALPWAKPTGELLGLQGGLSLDTMKDIRMSVDQTGEQIKKGLEQRKAEQVQIENQKAKAAAYYDDLLTQRIYAKEKAAEKLSALEEKYKAENEKSAAYTLRSARLAAEDKLQTATTAEEANSAYGEYIQKLQDLENSAIIGAEAVEGQRFEKMAQAEDYTEEERAFIDLTKERLEAARTAVLRELENEGTTDEFQAVLQTEIDNIDAAIQAVEGAIYYDEHYEEMKGQLVYEKLDTQYGKMGVTEIEALIEELRDSKVIPDGRGASYNYQEEHNQKVDAKIKDLKGYLKQRTQAEKDAARDERISESYEGVPGDHLLDKAVYLMERNGVKNRLRDSYETPSNFYKWNDEKQLKWIVETYGDGYDLEGFENWSDLEKKNWLYDREQELFVQTKGNLAELADARGGFEQASADITGYLHDHIVSYDESLFTDEQLEKYAAEAVRNYQNADKKLFGIDGRDAEMISAYVAKMWEYSRGIDGIFEGDYNSIVEDFEGFLEGDYGSFTEKEAKTILALMARYGTDEAFVHYAAVKEQALVRKAEELNGFTRTVAGITSGLTNFLINGGEMLENAFTQQYSRISGNILTASHQVNMEKINEMGIGGDAVEMLYMAGYSMFDMLPAVALGAVPVAGSSLSAAYTFAKVTANTYNDSIRQGKRADEALTYAMLSATAEVTMEKILGVGGQTFSNTGLGGKMKTAIEALSATKTMRVMVKTASSMGSEGFEEFLQECLDPFLQKVAADLNGIDDATLEEIDWEEAAKSFAIGALTGGVFGGIEAISSTKNGGMKESEARALLESDEVAKLIKTAAELGNQRANIIMQAYQSGQPLYEGQAGWFAYASPADVVNLTQSVKRRSVKASMRVLQEKYAERATDKGKRKTFDRLFKKILQGNTLTLQETADIINDPEMSAILNEMLGMDVTMMLPNQVLAVAKLAAFAENGKISRERLNLFKDAFGDLDTEAIEKIIKYSDMAAKKGGGIIYEDADAETQLTEAEQEAADVLKILSTEVGTVFYVTEQFDTGTYLAANMMAVRKGDLAGGVFKSATHRAYYMAKQLMADKGVDFKAFLLTEAKRIKGDEAVESEIKTILRQSAENGNDISRPTAENELCARLLGELLQKEGVLDRLAAADIDMVAALRKAVVALENHLDVQMDNIENVENKDPSKLHEQELRNLLKKIKNREISDGQNVPVRASTPPILLNFAKEMAEVHGENANLLNDTSIFMPAKKARQAMAFEEEWDGDGEAHELDEDDVINIIKKMNSPSILVYENSTGRIIEVINYKTEKSKKVLVVVEFNEFKGARHTNGYKQGNYQILVTLYPVTDKVKYNRMLKNQNNVIRLMDNKKDVSQLTSSIHVPSVLNDTPFYKFSISNSSENVNNNSDFSFFDGGSADVTDLVDRMTQLVRGEEVAGADGAGDGSDFDIDAYEDREFTYSDAEQVRAENDGAESARNFEDMTPVERAAEIADLQSEIDAIMTADISAQLEREEGSRESGYRDPVDRVGAKREQKKEPFEKTVKDSWNWARRKMVDSGQAIYDIGRKIKDDYLYGYYNMARASQQAGVTMISKWQTDVTGKVVGKSLQEIWAPIIAKGTEYAKQFDAYLLHLHNIDRMSRYDPEALEEARHQYEVEKAYLSDDLQKMSDDEIRAIAHDRDSGFVGEARDYINALDNYNHIRNIKDKPVFGYDVSAEDSRAAAENLERLYPEFKEYREVVYQYVDNLLQYRVDSGLISAETKAMLKTIYPHYVPTARVQAEEVSPKKHWWQKEKNREQTNKVIGKAWGGDQEIISLYDQIAGQTMSVVREGTKNRLGMRLLENYKNIEQIKNAELYSDKLTDPLLIDRHLDEIDPFMTLENKNIFAVFKAGEFWEMEVTDELWEAIDALDRDEEPQNGFKKFAKWNVDTFKRLITSLNPIFAIRNSIKDIADGLLYSKDTKRWLLAMPTAIKEMKKGGELWQQYVALGGGFSTYFDFARMGTKEPKGFGKVTGRIETLNQAVEQFPRFAEFIATVRKGDGSMDNLMEAMHNAADITTNFGRSGSTGRMLNRYWIPFFNPSIQGMSKAVRAWTEQRSVKGFVALGAKAVFFGIAPAVINALLYRDDEEWDMIKQTDKDRYFLFKIKEGLWARVPKGRMLSVFGGIGDRALQAIDGEEFEWASLIQTTVDQMAPSNPIESNIFGPLFLASINRTWYGTEIVGESLKNEPNAEQYDTKTDELSKWIGSVTGWSPKKINYVLDAYGGIVADVLLPALTPAAERTVWGNAFALDTNYSNRLSGDFYDKLDELSDQKNSVKATVEDAVLYRWWNRNADTVSEINAEIRRIEEDQSLTAKEKKKLVNEQYVIRNAAMLGFEETYDRYTEAVKKYSGKAAGMSEDDAKEYIYREANRELFGAEYALKAYGTSTYNRAVRVRDEQGIDFETFYDVYFDAEDPDVEKCFSLIEDGFEKETALEIARNIGALEPLDGAKSVSNIQKYGAIDAADITEDEKLWAMTVLATDTDLRKLTILAEYNVTLKQFVDVKNNITYLNDQNEGGVTNAMVKASIDHIKDVNNTQRAVLWQLFTGATSAKNNPYSVAAGAKVAAKNKALKESEE